jgi:drug/metabolite transporter (DMT)-like permease
MIGFVWVVVVKDVELSSEAVSRTGRAQTVAVGRLLGLLAATVLGLNTTFARLAYDAGSNPVTVLGGRFLACTLLIGIAVILLGRPFVIPRGSRLPTLSVTAIGFIGPTCYLWSVVFLPVSLAALLFYTFPLIVAVISHFQEGARLGPMRIGSFLLAFTGLVIALSPSLSELDWRGIALASVAAVSTAVTFILSRRLVSELGVFTFTMYMSAGSVILVMGIILLVGGIALPENTIGWTGLSGAAFGFVVGILAMFTAIKHVGSATAAMLLNLEPLITILAAAIVLGERLTMLQFTGGIMVVTALILSTRESAKHG